MKTITIKGRIKNPLGPPGYKWQEIELELPETELMERLRILLLEVGWKLGLGLKEGGTTCIADDSPSQQN